MGAALQMVPQIEIDAQSEAAAEAFWPAVRRTDVGTKGVVAFHPGSGSPNKLWPLEGWQEVMSWVQANGIHGMVIQGPAEHERGVQGVLQQVTPAWPWVEDLSLLELAALLKRCDVVLSHDSGVAHLAAASGATTLALFGPTDPSVWGPRSPRACVLQPATPQPLTLQNLSPEIVIQTLTALLDGSLIWPSTSVPCTIKRVP